MKHSLLTSAVILLILSLLGLILLGFESITKGLGLTDSREKLALLALILALPALINLRATPRP
jgi:hypothetical protein